ncbi:29058_t:CDS:2, partial [Racocetra persica]
KETFSEETSTAPVRDYLSSIDDDGGNIYKLCKQEFAENAEFNNFLKELDPHYRLPCRQTLSTWVSQDYIKNKNQINCF